ncbi:trehalose 6-phosphate synthase [Prosthecochloris sp. N3]|uniref:Trehalose 6-phosphate synthase n=1 Tax=Prosthecochloris ethylica TaxID=2743976 RepID=A0ABR9XRC3_9CHLB|nr:MULTISPECIES: trehalose 6-phosphate synthase [Prosthecochloris]MBF0586340.1 trehalose 6-phosphate synthase [Prosthecochloris ethylica]MBF0636442.1 trehalose 6-phosphate synthase [Prosthecochloris ethylica]NUK47616.1 trehalose 6-phosphate synthase [Prosthecochloris ethylica]RNA64150.1 trehalose 6-phosphate synthase [Prosthecochloris sp. ZM_2]
MSNLQQQLLRLQDEDKELLYPLKEYLIPDIDINLQNVSSFKELFHLKALTRVIRAPIVRNIFAARVINLRTLESLRNARRSLEFIYYKDYDTSMIRIDRHHTVHVDLSYEIRELKKDTYYLEHGEDDFIDYIRKFYNRFDEYVLEGLEFLDSRRFNCFITDRDGTTNNYCGHYRSSIQPIYNAVFLSRFALLCTEHPVFITSAPLKNFGILDVSVNPDNVFIYAGSKGREFIDLDGVEHRAWIEPFKQRRLEELNRRVSELEKSSEYEKFFYIGSGLQLKFGQLTLARQDVTNSIPDDESARLLQKINEIVCEIDPDGAVFRVNDTGRDIEVIITVDGPGQSREFNKGDGLKYLDSCLSLDLDKGPHLVCGDTASDLPMLEAVLEFTDDVYAIFVTRDPALEQRVRSLCPHSLIVPSPDILLTILGMSALKIGSAAGHGARRCLF